MRALLISPEYPLSFWSFRKALRLGGYKVVNPPLGLLTIAALLPAAWELRLADLSARPLQEDDWQWADLVMISAFHIQKAGFLDLVKEAKSRGKTVVAGGPFPTLFPEQALEAGVDFVVRGEGENTVPLFLEALREGRAGVIEIEERPDLTASPIPRFDLLRMEDYRTITIQTCRGCPFNCEFCDVERLFGRKPRYKTPQQVVGELDALYRLGRRGSIFICDDNFIANRQRARAILQELTPWLRDRGHPFSFLTQSSINLGQDKELMDLMVRARFERVFAGIESPDEKILESQRKYHNIRHPLVESIHNLRRNGIEVIGSFILGFDGERKGAGRRICAFTEENALPMVMVNALQAPPHTALWDRLAGEGRLREGVEFIAEAFISAFNFEPDRPEAEILEEYAQAWDYLYQPSRYLARVYRYYLDMPPVLPEVRQAALSSPPPPGAAAPESAGRGKLADLKALGKILWWLGVRGPARRQFWIQLLGLWRRNPTRLRMYLRSCLRVWDLSDMRLLVRDKVAALLQDQQTPQQRPAPAASCRTEGAPL
ncbi:MAG: DUF4070 domain-containing protein [Deltaproteobacteria bacterium]|nr:DUF4070 domain-containing protein [Deltaproteobacteria bacterium]